MADFVKKATKKSLLALLRRANKIDSRLLARLFEGVLFKDEYETFAAGGGLGFVRTDGTVPLTADWDAGSYEIRAKTLESDVTTGTAPLTIASTTLVTNLNSDKLDSQEGTYYLDRTNHTGVDTGSEVELLEIGTATYDDVQDFVNQAWSSGVISGLGLTDGGGATITIASGTGFIADADDANARNIKLFDYAGATTTALSDGTTRYVYINYNSGTPVYSLETSGDLDEWDRILLGWATNEGGTLHIVNAPQLATGYPFRVSHALREVWGFRRADAIGGLIIGESGDSNRNVSLTAGEIYFGINEFDIDAVDTSGVGTFTRYYPVAGVWTAQTGLTQWPNTQYSDGTDLQDLTVNRYGCLWWYVDVEDNELIMLYGTSNSATQTGAENEDPPASPPERVAKGCVLLGRYVFRKSGSVPVLVQSAFSIAFNAAGVSDHGALAGLTDDDHTQYLLADGTRALTGNWDAGSFEVRAQTFESDVTTGTAPLTIASTTVVTNLNSDKVDGKDETAFVLVDGTRPLTGNWDAGSFEVRAQTFESDVTTGTAPFTIASTTVVTNLNADKVDGKDETAFVLADGTRALTGDWDVGAFDLRAADVTADSGGVYTDNINELTGAAGVTIDGVLVKDYRLGIGDSSPATPSAPLQIKDTAASDIIRQMDGTAVTSPQSVMTLRVEGTKVRGAGAGSAFVFAGQDDGANAEFMGRVGAYWINPADGSENSGVAIYGRNSGGSAFALDVQAKFKDGEVNLKVPTSEPADADLENDSIIFYYDSGGPSLMVKHKNSGGTTTTGTVAALS